MQAMIRRVADGIDHQQRENCENDQNDDDFHLPAIQQCDPGHGPRIATLRGIFQTGSGTPAADSAAPWRAASASSSKSSIRSWNNRCQLISALRRTEEHTTELQSLMRISDAVL